MSNIYGVTIFSSKSKLRVPLFNVTIESYDKKRAKKKALYLYRFVRKTLNTAKNPKVKVYKLWT